MSLKGHKIFLQSHSFSHIFDNLVSLLTLQIERIVDKRIDEISREKEEYLADGVPWSDNYSNTPSDTKTVFNRITSGSELDLAQAYSSISIECRERFRRRSQRIIYRLSVKVNPFSKEAESSTNAPLSTNFWTVLSMLEVDKVFNILLSYFPKQVQAALGKPEITIDDLLALPR